MLIFQKLLIFFHIDTKCFNSEFKLFQEYLRIRGIAPNEVLNKLATSPAVLDLATEYPSFHKTSLQFLDAPVSTATVERTFSKMNHICNKVRQRLTPDQLECAMLIALKKLWKLILILKMLYVFNILQNQED